MALSVQLGDQVTVKHSPYVWRVTRIKEVGITCRKVGDASGRTHDFFADDILSVVQRGIGGC